LHISVLQQAGRSPSNRMLTKYWTHNTGSMNTMIYVMDGGISVSIEDFTDRYMKHMIVFWLIHIYCLIISVSLSVNIASVSAHRIKLSFIPSLGLCVDLSGCWYLCPKSVL